MTDKKLIPVTQVDQAGIVRDTPAHILPPNAWSDGRNIRFKDGSVHKREGTVKAFADITATDLTIANISYWPEPIEQVYVEVVSNTTANTYSINTIGPSGTRTAATAATGATAPSAYPVSTTNITRRDWQTTLFAGGYNLILNDTINAPYYLTLDTTGDEPVASVHQFSDWNALTPTGNFAGAKVIRGVGSRLIAGNLTNRNTGTRAITSNSPGTIRISDIASPGQVPSWTGGTTSLVDEFELSNTAEIQEILPLQGQAIVYTTDSIHSISFDGSGNANVRTVAEGYGAFTTGSVLEFDGRHLVVGSDDIYLFGGHPGSIQSVADGKLREFFFEDINPVRDTQLNMFMVREKALDEIHIYYPTRDSNNNCDRYIAWNYRNNTWSINDVPEGGVISGAVGPIRGGGLAGATLTFSSSSTDLSSGGTFTAIIPDFSSVGVDSTTTDTASLATVLPIGTAPGSAAVSTVITSAGGAAAGAVTLIARRYSDINEFGGGRTGAFVEVRRNTPQTNALNFGARIPESDIASVPSSERTRLYSISWRPAAGWEGGELILYTEDGATEIARIQPNIAQEFVTDRNGSINGANTAFSVSQHTFGSTNVSSRWTFNAPGISLVDQTFAADGTSSITAALSRLQAMTNVATRLQSNALITTAVYSEAGADDTLTVTLAAQTGQTDTTPASFSAAPSTRTQAGVTTTVGGTPDFTGIGSSVATNVNTGTAGGVFTQAVAGVETVTIPATATVNAVTPGGLAEQQTITATGTQSNLGAVTSTIDTAYVSGATSLVLDDTSAFSDSGTGFITLANNTRVALTWSAKDDDDDTLTITAITQDLASGLTVTSNLGATEKLMIELPAFTSSGVSFSLDPDINDHVYTTSIPATAFVANQTAQQSLQQIFDAAIALETNITLDTAITTFASAPTGLTLNFNTSPGQTLSTANIPAGTNADPASFGRFNGPAVGGSWMALPDTNADVNIGGTSVTSAGVLHFYENVSGTWTYRSTVGPAAWDGVNRPDLASNGAQGTSITAAGDRVAVGRRRSSVIAGRNSIEIFARSGSTWSSVQELQLDAVDVSATPAIAGISISPDGNWLIYTDTVRHSSNPLGNPPPATQDGRVLIYRWDGTQFVFHQRFIDQGLGSGDWTWVGNTDGSEFISVNDGSTSGVAYYHLTRAGTGATAVWSVLQALRLDDFASAGLSAGNNSNSYRPERYVYFDGNTMAMEQDDVLRVFERTTAGTSFDPIGNFDSNFQEINAGFGSFAFAFDGGANNILITSDTNAGTTADPSTVRWYTRDAEGEQFTLTGQVSGGEDGNFRHSNSGGGTFTDGLNIFVEVNFNLSVGSNDYRYLVYTGAAGARGTLDLGTTTNIEASLTLTGTDAPTATITATDGVHPHSSYRVNDEDGMEITTFTHSRGNNGASATDLAFVLAQVEAAIDSNNETPINFTAAVVGSTVVLTGAELGDSAGTFTVVPTHATTGATADRGNLAFTTAVTRASADPPDQPYYTFVGNNVIENIRLFPNGPTGSAVSEPSAATDDFWGLVNSGPQPRPSEAAADGSIPTDDTFIATSDIDTVPTDGYTVSWEGTTVVRAGTDAPSRAELEAGWLADDGFTYFADNLDTTEAFRNVGTFGFNWPVRRAGTPAETAASIATDVRRSLNILGYAVSGTGTDIVITQNAGTEAPLGERFVFSAFEPDDTADFNATSAETTAGVAEAASTAGLFTFTFRNAGTVTVTSDDENINTLLQSIVNQITTSVPGVTAVADLAARSISIAARGAGESPEALTAHTANPGTFEGPPYGARSPILLTVAQNEDTNADRPWLTTEFNLARDFVLVAGDRFIHGERFGYTFGADPTIIANPVVGTSYDSYVERIHNSLDGEVEHTKAAESVQLLLSDGDVDVQLGMTDAPGDTDSLYVDERGQEIPTRTFFYENDYKVDWRRHGRLFNIRISDPTRNQPEDDPTTTTVTPQGWRVSGYGLSAAVEERRGGRRS